MTIQQLQYIVALDTHRHFVRAAESCFVAQPTLTLQVKKLESEIGVPLFDRSSQPIAPTEIGQQFILKARQVLREIDALKSLVNQDKNNLTGTYTIGVIPTLAPYLLPLFLKVFTEKFPQITLSIKELQSETIMKKLLTDELDIGLMATPLEEAYLREIPLFYEPFWLYAHPNHSISKKEISDATAINEKGLWLLDKGHCFRNQTLNICQEASALTASDQLAFESGSIETLKNMVQCYQGYTLIPELAIHHQADAQFVKPLPKPQAAREISLVVHKNFSKELLLEKFRKTINQAVPDHFQKNEKYLRIKWR